LVAHLADRHEVVSLGRSVLDFLRPETFSQVLAGISFDTLIVTAAMTSPDVCEEDAEAAMRVNAVAPGVLAGICAARGARCIHLSTDYVFAGDGNRPLDEGDPAQPVNVYGRSKLAGERAVLAAAADALVCRVSWLFGPTGVAVPETAIERARQGQPLGFIDDKWSVPTSITQVCDWLERLSCDLRHACGILHLCNSGSASWREYAQQCLDFAFQYGILDRPYSTHPLSLRDFPQFKAQRPPYTVMDNARLAAMLGSQPPSWQDALEAHIAAMA
jgi:dTDP-4-dehydrorhamnose reductase